MSSARKFQRRARPATYQKPSGGEERHDLVLYFRRGLYYSRIWFLGDGTMDVLCVLKRELPDGLWCLDYRFRYYEDEKTFGSNDRKSFYSGTYPNDAPEAEVVEKTGEAVALIAEMRGLDIDVTVIESDDPDGIHAKLREKPYFGMRADLSGVVQ